MTMSVGDWEASGGRYTLMWGGRPWMIQFDEHAPGLRCRLDRSYSKHLSLYGLAAAGRCELDVFSPASLVNIERYRSRLQATFTPGGWGGLTVRAAWGPSCAGAGVDLEIQATASTVDQLRAVEVMVQSEWQFGEEPGGLDFLSRRVLPRDAHAAGLSYDGRETAGALLGLTTLPLAGLPHPRVFTPPGVDGGDDYLEMCQPDDVARQIRLEPGEPHLPLSRTLALRYGLFGHDFEKGVVFRARLRACWLPTATGATDAVGLYEQFLAEPLPLGP